MEKGIKHLIRCRCFLPQFKGKPNPPNHQFVVFSVLDDEDVIKASFAQCNNCGLIHKVTDICVSEIMPGRENMSSILSIDEIKVGMSEQLVALLETHQVDQATWEQAAWILEKERWGDPVILSSELVDGIRQGKYVRIIGKNLFKVDSFAREEIVNPGNK